MKIHFVVIGKPSSQWAKEANAHYQRFLAKYAQCDWRWVRAVTARGLSADAIRQKESAALLDSVSGISGYKILCDRAGKTFRSEALAKEWQTGTDRNGGRAVIVIGGAWGVDERLHAWADLVWSFGPATYPHELALTMATEQIARALSILRGDSYHK